MIMHFQKYVIRYTLTNIMSIDESINEAQEDNVNISKYYKWEWSQSILLRYLLSAHHRLPLLHTENNMVIYEKEEKTFINFKLDIC